MTPEQRNLNLTTRMLQVLYELNAKGHYTAWLDWAGHTNGVYIKIIKGKWTEKKQKKKPYYEALFRTKTYQWVNCLNNEIFDENAFFDMIDKLSEYKTKPKPIPIEKHFPFFSVHPESERKSFIYKRRKYTAMGCVKDDDYTELIRNCDSTLNKENTPEGYSHADFYRVAEKENGIIKTDIFMYEDRLVVPFESVLTTFSVRRLIENS